eukprot:CAMPEP_0197473444 /NCGR_PEP_ID=MMETSP1309-20131121/4805_1 /TAXON_ID=464262 /ORGANISM="Genus nov. species nov., Strain RCC998" /LENGTH=273 /DNA_ID=CAMNT_0043012557 /DNA_START=13 /DNA_END=831 /DNA_ORIENTATION=+
MAPGEGEIESKMAGMSLNEKSGGGPSFSDMYAAFEAFERASAATGGPGAAKGKEQKKGKGTDAPADGAKGKGKGEGGGGGDGGGEQKKGKKKDKGKKEKGKKEEKKAAPAAEVDVSILDIRVGKIVEVEPHPEADGLYLEQIDLGEGKPRQVISGLRKFVEIEDMKNRDVVVILNLKPAKMRGIMSNGMVLCASNDDHTKVDPLRPPEGAAIGEKITFEGFSGEPIEVINPKKKLLEKLFPDLKTDADGVATYKGAVFKASTGVCKASLQNAW